MKKSRSRLNNKLSLDPPNDAQSTPPPLTIRSFGSLSRNKRAAPARRFRDKLTLQGPCCLLVAGWSGTMLVSWVRRLGREMDEIGDAVAQDEGQQSRPPSQPDG